MPVSRSFLDASIPDLVKKLRVDEKVSLLAGPNWWNTSAVERLEIPAIRMSDGPNVIILALPVALAELIFRVSAALPTSWLHLRNAYPCVDGLPLAHVYIIFVVRDGPRSHL